MNGSALHDVEDPILFARNALNDELRRRGAWLDPARFDDAIGYFSELLVKLSRRYDPSLGLSFSTWAYDILCKRYTDFLRKDRGDSRYGNDGREQAVHDPDSYRTSQTDADTGDVLALIDQLDHSGLSMNARGALRHLVSRITEGVPASQAAEQLGLSSREARRDLKRLRAELAGDR